MRKNRIRPETNQYAACPGEWMPSNIVLNISYASIPIAMIVPRDVPGSGHDHNSAMAIRSLLHVGESN